ncbi:MAG: hypothetical protein LBP40_01955 [Campylobacteraceae bacterium]|nr:hypothetical protein [Campylobacteraceae bacterium]
MIKPKGFGKRYFTLSSIQAHSCAAKLHGVLVSVHLFFAKTNKDKESSGENDPPQECENPCDYLNLHHFCCLFLRRVQKISKTKRHFYKIYNRLCYGFCRSGIHPPNFTFTNFLKNIITPKGKQYDKKHYYGISANRKIKRIKICT